MAETTAAPNSEAVRSNVKQILLAYLERIERLNEDIKQLNDDKRDVFAEMKGNGFDVKVMKEIVKLRKQDPNERAEHETILETYLREMGLA